MLNIPATLCLPGLAASVLGRPTNHKSCGYLCLPSANAVNIEGDYEIGHSVSRCVRVFVCVHVISK